MSAYLAVPFLAFVAVLQAGLVSHLTVWGVSPDLPLLVVVAWSLLGGWREGVAWGVVAGLAVDVLSGAPLGAASLGLVAAGLLGGLGTAGLSRANIVLPLGAAFLATLLYDLVFLLVRQPSAFGALWLDALWRIVLPSAALNVALVLPLLWFLRLARAGFRRHEVEL